jgi:lipid II:glycine glycyltransferase (peptidoglycan interpeptide bridge formation enzyme)
LYISKISLEQISNYDKLSKEYGTLFNTYEWLNLFEKVNLYGIYDKGNNLIGGFHIYKKSKLGFSIYGNAPFTPYNGPFIKMDAQNPANTISKYREVLLSMADFLDNLNYSKISISLDKNIIDTLPFIWKKFKVVPRYTYILDLDRSLDDIYKNMTAERRNDIKKGINDKLTVEKINDYNIVKSLVLKTFLRQKKAINEIILDKILFTFANTDNSFAFATFKDGKPIATVFCVYDKQTSYYLLGGYDFENKHHGAGPLTMWESIKYSKEIGLKYFDFEGSIIPQIEKYFRGFGGKLIPYYTVNKAKLPIEILLKLVRREVF